MGSGASAEAGVQGRKIEDYWKLGKKLGKGSFATVFLATKINKEDERMKHIPDEVAIKRIVKSNVPAADLPLLGVEVEIMRKLDHRYVVKLYDVFDDEQYLDLVIESLHGGEMFERIVEKGHYNEADAAHVVKQLAEGLKYLHTQGIVHRDLKPENLLYESEKDSCDIKITDFGLAKLTDGDTPALMRTACGTPGYVAPEILSGKSYGQEVDVWSLGVIMYILLCGFPPFYSENDAELYALIRTATYSFPSPYWDSVSKEAKELVQQLLVVDPKKRLTTEDILANQWVLNKKGTVSKLPLGEHVVDGLKNIQSKNKWRKAQLQIDAVDAFKNAKEIKNKWRKKYGSDSDAVKKAEEMIRDQAKAFLKGKLGKVAAKAKEAVAAKGEDAAASNAASGADAAAPSGADAAAASGADAAATSEPNAGALDANAGRA